MKSRGIPKSTLQFLRALAKNNQRPWFNEHKDRYQDEHGYMISFAERIMHEMNKVDVLVPMSGKQSLFRIYRDVRFSKDKSPYKKAFSGRLKRATELRRGGMYYHIEPGNSLIAGGFWNPNSSDVARIRQDLAFDSRPMRKILNSASFKKYFGELEGAKVKTSPKGYNKDHPDIDLLRYKQFLMVRRFSNQEVLDDSFEREVVKTFKAMRPFFDYMTDVLTTDANGVRIGSL